MNASASLLLSAWLDGRQEGLDSVKAKGVVGIKMNATMDSAVVFGAFSNLTGPITSAHFHPGLRGVTNPPSMPITAWINGNSISAGWNGIGKSTLDSMMRGLFYINIHTAAHPNGEIRGQLELERDLQFTADIKGTNETAPVTTAAEGMGFFQLSADDSTLTTWVVYRKPADSENDTLTLAHFHIGPPGANGPVAINLSTDTAGGTISARKALSAPMNGITAAAFLDSLKKGSVYINFHSKLHPAGIIRGQLLPSQERLFAAQLTGTGSGITGKGLGIVGLSADNSRLSVKAAYSGLTGAVTAAHFHKGSPVVVPIDSSAVSATGISAEITLADVASPGFNPRQFIDDMLMGNIYLNVHTAANPAGEISGTAMMPVRRGSAFRLDGSQEVPPVTTKAFGAAVVSMDMDSTNVRFMVVADSLDSTFTAAHFHKQAAGVAGGVVHDIGSRFSMNADNRTGLVATGVWTSQEAVNPFSKPLAKALLMDSLYINIHTARNPSGAIRGQVGASQGGGVGILEPSRKSVRKGFRLRPALGGIRFQGDPGGTFDVRILDLKGKVLKEIRISLNASGWSDPVDLSRLGPGLYAAAWQEHGRRAAARFFRP